MNFHFGVDAMWELSSAQCVVVQIDTRYSKACEIVKDSPVDDSGTTKQCGANASDRQEARSMGIQLSVDVMWRRGVIGGVGGGLSCVSC